ncbi:glycerophosphodiester phosphodiesterase [Tepidicella xavieri]|jgi:glycerophosphoryl diester phosphodiesterase|uniref:Glycerophosphoryl diester phosphodiesterase n=1 Tax=Tepidicella xavieri TaxID=360241 RepID=A0A4R6UC58_9BURK|nr:glycerophosphodiester phosphodiesterase [Tepidicella xavieri]TDQ40654.1 glycerophosphoryl diester phosphodiesterase [Tepidicella xavieri]
MSTAFPTPWPYPLWIAHRGAGKDAPENTLVAFQRGWEAGFRMFECDVKLSADGVPYLLHDATLDRTTNGHGPVEHLPWADLARLDAGGWHSARYAGERLLRLDQLAAWCETHGALVNLEIKPVPGHEAATGAAVARAVQTLWGQATVPPLLTSFQPHALQAAQQAAPELPRGLLLEKFWPGWEGVAEALQCVALVGHHPLIDAALMQTAQRHGWRVLSYTVNDPAEARRLRQLGVEGLITDIMHLPATV